MSVRVVIMARYPVAGQCKTRLMPALGPEGAADMHRRLAERTVERVRQSGLHFELWGTGGSAQDFASWLGDVPFREQPGGDLGQRLEAAGSPYPVIYLGTDCPGIEPGYLREAAAHLDGGRAVLGPAHDGGYWTLGLPQAVPSVLSDMPWGTEHVYELTLQRLRAAGQEVVLLPMLHDIDRPEDLVHFAAEPA
ncbi:TIGR04282 family arsenosugar biosynthesis glycosyltransferase [Parvularcula maris]|uniref:TIGR04282 family arsenosugar biosynthesis glycosyltransferase n=1 Tax=Parvularcula maris TaxID=2965077 RepID=A0A9X2RJ93_9PROT|nr:TIGR04282 family arsenosugar biosynthesis glycosyltransferase [Parvularcula maris]MCQ8184443.1 TIGR04282 family arsenosugar biosynthesis glycosyltransferase [Parvularcula maris]